jgi:hypothetical protein
MLTEIPMHPAIFDALLLHAAELFAAGVMVAALWVGWMMTARA